MVTIWALCGISYLADFASGASFSITSGTTDAPWGKAAFTVVTFLTGFPLANYSARYNLDPDLITQGSGFGYHGSVANQVIFAAVR